MKPAAVKSLIYKEFYMARKPLLIQTVSLILFAVLGILVELSFRIGNLALLPDAVLSEIKEMVDFSVILFPVFMAGSFSYTISEVSVKDENIAWKRFCYTLPAGHMDFAMAKYLSMLLIMAAEIVISFAYVAAVCRVMGILFSRVYLSYILAVIAAATVMAVSYHIGILLFHTRDKAGLFMLGVFLGICLIVVYFSGNFSVMDSGNIGLENMSMRREAIDAAVVNRLPWFAVMICAVWGIGFLISTMLYKRRE